MPCVELPETMCLVDSNTAKRREPQAHSRSILPSKPLRQYMLTAHLMRAHPTERVDGDDGSRQVEIESRRKRLRVNRDNVSRGALC
jgi:hypothetical protein